MVKTQVQIPDHLYREAKRVSGEYEMSFAEVVRRGLEKIVVAYPPRNNTEHWSPPKPRRLGWRGVSIDELKEQAQKTTTEELLEAQAKQKRR